MSSSLSKDLLGKIRDVLRKDPTSFAGPAREFMAIAAWNTELVNAVSDALLASPPTEANIADLHTWGRIVFSKMRELNNGEAVTSLYGLAQITDFVFKYISRPTKIPFEYWEDIAPDLWSEVRRFRLQAKPFDQYFASDFRTDMLAEKDKWLATNPETAELFQRWESENLFG